MLEPFDVTKSETDMTELKEFKMSEPEQFRLPEGYVTYGADLATDSNIYTCSWSKSSGADDLAFFSMTFEKPYFVDEVKVHMMFFISSGLREQWLDGGNYDYDNCHLTAGHYYVCGKQCGGRGWDVEEGEGEAQWMSGRMEVGGVGGGGVGGGGVRGGRSGSCRSGRSGRWGSWRWGSERREEWEL